MKPKRVRGVEDSHLRVPRNLVSNLGTCRRLRGINGGPLLVETKRSNNILILFRTTVHRP